MIGIAVTGADRMEEADDTKKHGFIPVEALNLLPDGPSGIVSDDR